MKRLFTILLFSLSMATILLADEVKVDRSNCTITKDGKTFQMQGDVRIVNYGGSDVIDIRLVDYGGADVVEVTKLEWLIMEAPMLSMFALLITAGLM